MSTPVSPEFEIAVFKKGVKTSGIASERIAREEAQHYVDCGVARWVNNRYKSVQMLIEAMPCNLRGESCQMGPRIIQRAAEGKYSAVVMTAAWRGRRAA